MYIGLKHLHSFFAIITLFILLSALAYSIYSLVAKKPFSKNNKLLNLLGMMLIHTQIVFGLILYFVSPLGLSKFSGEAMKVSFNRMFIIEHPLMMIIAGVLITIGYIRSKNAAIDIIKHKAIIIFYAIGLILIALRIPWQYWIN